MHSIRRARAPGEIQRCFSVMCELRPHLTKPEFVDRVRAMQDAGYVLAFLETPPEVISAAGYRVLDSLSRGRFLYVDDFVTRAASRRNGFGAALFEWLVTEARSLGCHSIHLDSGPNRTEAHRFYEMQNMVSSTRHYWLPLETPE